MRTRASEERTSYNIANNNNTVTTTAAASSALVTSSTTTTSTTAATSSTMNAAFKGNNYVIERKEKKKKAANAPPGWPYNYNNYNYSTYRAFHRFVQAKIAYGGLVLGSSQFLILPQLPLKMMLASKVVKIDLKIIISLC